MGAWPSSRTSILFRLTAPAALDEHQFMVLAAVDQMRFLAPVFPGQTMILEIST